VAIFKRDVKGIAQEILEEFRKEKKVELFSFFDSTKTGCRSVSFF